MILNVSDGFSPLQIALWRWELKVLWHLNIHCGRGGSLLPCLYCGGNGWLVVRVVWWSIRCCVSCWTDVDRLACLGDCWPYRDVCRDAGARGSWMCGAVHVPCVWWELVAVCRVAGGARRGASLCVNAWR